MTSDWIVKDSGVRRAKEQGFEYHSGSMRSIMMRSCRSTQCLLDHDETTNYQAVKSSLRYALFPHHNTINHDIPTTPHKGVFPQQTSHTIHLNKTPACLDASQRQEQKSSQPPPRPIRLPLRLQRMRSNDNPPHSIRIPLYPLPPSLIPVSSRGGR